MTLNPELLGTEENEKLKKKLQKRHAHLKKPTHSFNSDAMEDQSVNDMDDIIENDNKGH